MQQIIYCLLFYTPRGCHRTIHFHHPKVFTVWARLEAFYTWMSVPISLKGIQHSLPFLQIFTEKVSSGVFTSKENTISTLRGGDLRVSGDHVNPPQHRGRRLLFYGMKSYSLCTPRTLFNSSLTTTHIDTTLSQ